MRVVEYTLFTMAYTAHTASIHITREAMDLARQCSWNTDLFADLFAPAATVLSVLAARSVSWDGHVFPRKGPREPSSTTVQSVAHGGLASYQLQVGMYSQIPARTDTCQEQCPDLYAQRDTCPSRTTNSSSEQYVC